MKKISRKKFLRNATLSSLGVATGVSACQTTSNDEVDVPNIITNKKYRWKMVTTWPPNFPVVDEGCQLVARLVNEMSGGRLQIKVFGAGELIPGLETFDAVQSGAAELGSGAAYYWAGKIPAAQFFASVPFGMNAQQMNAWLMNAGGLEMWRDAYAPFGVRPMLGGNTGVQMAGWFNKEIYTVDDLKGLKMRIPGLGGKVLNKAGGTAILSPGNELYTNLERGILDATEWIGPYHDYLMGFYQIAKYYYTPGWHEAGTVLEYLVNQSKYDELPKDLQTILDTACIYSNQWVMSEFEAKNAFYLRKLVQEENVDVRRLPDEVLSSLKTMTQEVVEEMAESDPLAKKAYEAFRSFKKDVTEWAELSEKVFYNGIA